MFGQYCIPTLHQNRGPLHYVLQLAYVPLPYMRFEDSASRLRSCGDNEQSWRAAMQAKKWHMILPDTPAPVKSPQTNKKDIISHFLNFSPARDPSLINRPPPITVA